MRLFHFIVGDHCFAIDYRNSDDMRRLLPSYAPFVTHGGNPQPASLITVDDSLQMQIVAKAGTADEVGQFDCGGANHGVYRTPDGGYLFEISDYDCRLSSVLQSNADFSKIDVALIGNDARKRAYGLNNALMIAYAFATADKDTLVMHSSVIRNGGRGYMFLGASGTGKSTHTRLWRENIPGSDLLNDDNPVLRCINGELRVYGTPWSGKTPCYRNLSVPVGAITLLEQRPYNRIARQNVAAALAALLPSASNMKWDKRVHNGVIATLAKVIGHVPVYLMGCLPDADAARTSYNAIARP